MTKEQEQILDQMLQIVRESAQRIIDDNNNINQRDLLMYLYQKGFEFIQDQNDQNIVDIGSVGLAFSVMRRSCHK